MSYCCIKPRRFEDPLTAASCVSYPWFCLVIALSLLCTLSFKCPAGCSMIECSSDILVDDFNPNIDHGRHVHHNMTMDCTCNDGTCDNKVPTRSGTVQIVFGVIFGLICLVGFYLNSCVFDYRLFEFEGGVVQCKLGNGTLLCFSNMFADFLKSYQNNSASWKYLVRFTVICLLLGFALSFVSSFSVVLINVGLLLLIFIVYIHFRSRKDATRQDNSIEQQLLQLLPLRPRNN